MSNKPVVVRGYPTAAAATAAEKHKDSLLNKMNGLTVSSTGVVTHDSLLMLNKKILDKKILGVKFLNIKNNETSIDHLSDKLTFIDGKEATAKDLKNLRASDIESMSVKKGTDMIKQYGDKAKNGVVFITTTKAKK